MAERPKQSQERSLEAPDLSWLAAGVGREIHSRREEVDPPKKLSLTITVGLFPDTRAWNPDRES